MKQFTLFLIYILSSLFGTMGQCQTTPPIPTIMYDPHQWDYDPAPYGGFAKYPNSGISAHTVYGTSEPMSCYPLNSGIVKGVSDTVAVWVCIQNNDTIDFTIGSYKPENWFMPAVYNVLLNPGKFEPFLDSSQIGYSFQGWADGHFWSVNTPTLLPKIGGVPFYSLLYYIWDLPVGKTRLLMLETASMPTGVQVLVNYVPPLTVVESKSVADTINAFGACAWREYNKHSYLTASSWCDSMLAKNQFCIPAYSIKATINGIWGIDDSLSEKNALDSTIAILARYGDPLLGDTIDWNEHTRQWYLSMNQWASFQRWKSVNGERQMRTL